MSNDPIMFVHDGEQWLNVAAIDGISDVFDARGTRRQVTMRSGRRFESPGTPQELLDKLDELANLGADHVVDDMDRPRFPRPGRGIPD